MLIDIMVSLVPIIHNEEIAKMVHNEATVGHIESHACGKISDIRTYHDLAQDAHML